MSVSEAIKGARIELASISSTSERLKRAGRLAKIFASELAGTASLAPYGARNASPDFAHCSSCNALANAGFATAIALDAVTRDSIVPLLSGLAGPSTYCLLYKTVNFTSQEFHIFCDNVARSFNVTGYRALTLHRSLPAYCPSSGPLAGRVSILRDQAYMPGKDRTVLDVYVPPRPAGGAEAPERFPVVLFCHGGALFAKAILLLESVSILQHLHA